MILCCGQHFGKKILGYFTAAVLLASSWSSHLEFWSSQRNNNDCKYDTAQYCNATFHFGVAKVIRSSGQALDSIGKRFELNPFTEKLQPSTQAVKLGKRIPNIDGVFVAPSATVVGNVTIAKGASVWYGAVLRGDESYIKVDSGASIGDRVMVHCANYPKEFPTIVGKNVVVNAGAILHGCVLEDGSVVGEGSQILDGAKVGQNAVVAPGSLLGMGKVVPAGQVWGGVPARFLRNVSDAELARMTATVAEHAALAAEHGQESAKSWQAIEQEEYDYEQKVCRNDNYYRRLSPQEISEKLGEVENHMVPGRIFNSPVSSKSHAESRP